VTKIAKHVGLTNNAIYRWIRVNRIPGEYILKVANFYDVEIVDLLPLTGSDISSVPKVSLKPRDTIPTLLKVQRGEITLDEAATMLNQRSEALRLILIHWNERLELLHTTLELLDSGTISLDEGAKLLGVVKYTLHGIRRKYGYAPGPLKKTKPEPTIAARKSKNRTAALRVIAGISSAAAISEEMGVSSRTIFRYVERLTPHSLNDLSHWPTTYRQALVDEIELNLPSYAEKWLDFAKKSNLLIKKYVTYPSQLSDVKKQPLKRLLVAVLTGEMSLDEVAMLRGADPLILKSLFTSDLVPMGVDFDTLMGLPVAHQMAVAELLIWMLDRKRAFNVK
jgi:transposase